MDLYSAYPLKTSNALITLKAKKDCVQKLPKTRLKRLGTLLIPLNGSFTNRLIFLHHPINHFKVRVVYNTAGLFFKCSIGLQTRTSGELYRQLTIPCITAALC